MGEELEEEEEESQHKAGLRHLRPPQHQLPRHLQSHDRIRRIPQDQDEKRPGELASLVSAPI